MAIWGGYKLIKSIGRKPQTLQQTSPLGRYLEATENYVKSRVEYMAFLDMQLSRLFELSLRRYGVEWILADLDYQRTQLEDLPENVQEDNINKLKAILRDLGNICAVAVNTHLPDNYRIKQDFRNANRAFHSRSSYLGVQNYREYLETSKYWASVVILALKAEMERKEMLEIASVNSILGATPEPSYTDRLDAINGLIANINTLSPLEKRNLVSNIQDEIETLVGTRDMYNNSVQQKIQEWEEMSNEGRSNPLRTMHSISRLIEGALPPTVSDPLGVPRIISTTVPGNIYPIIDKEIDLFTFIKSSRDYENIGTQVAQRCTEILDYYHDLLGEWARKKELLLEALIRLRDAILEQ